jgi:peptide/nickel transport system permease protein
MPTLITGSLLLEAYFGIPGLGSLLLKAIQSNDLPVVKSITVMGSFIYIFFNLLNDLLAAFFDARVELR